MAGKSRHFYFLVAANNAQIQAMTDQPNSQLPSLMRVMSVLSFFVCCARYAGADKITTINQIATIYFTKITMFILISKIGGFCPLSFPVLMVYIPYFADLSSSSSIRIN